MVVQKSKTGAGSVPSMQNVAAYAGVSIATVSKVMQGEPTVRRENVTAVQNAIEALGYRINPLAAELRRGRRKLIGVVVPSFDHLSTVLVDSLESHAAERGYALWAASSEQSTHREGEIINRFQDWRVAGLIVVPASSSNGSTALLVSDTIATVYVECGDGAIGCDTVSTDMEGAACAVVNRLTRLGHERIAIVAREDDAFLPRMSEASMAAVSSNGSIVTCRLDVRSASDQVVNATRTLLDGAARPTAVVALGPHVTSIVEAYAVGRGWEIPSDLSIVTLLNEQVARANACLSALCYPAEAIAEKAIDAILRRVEQPTASMARLVETCHFQSGSRIASPRPIEPLRSVGR